ncbi:MAG: kelch repeat-containing protein [candidate division WOR-3 bacterium]
MRKFAIISLTFISVIFSAEWQITANPTPRSMAVAVTDSIGQRMILFGGGNYRLPWGGHFNDVWILDFNTQTWKLFQLPQPLPTPRRSPSMVYHPILNSVILFGGRDDYTFYNDVWVLNLNPGYEVWTQIFPSGTPPVARDAHSAIFDPVNNRMIVFGGYDAGGNNFNDVWALNLNDTTWIQINPSGSPPPIRGAHTSIYDPIAHRMIVFGGNSSPIYNDVWALNLNYGNESWQQLSPSGTLPGARTRHWAVYDNQNHEMILGFGYDYPGYMLYYNDVWALNLNSLVWHQIIPSGVNIEGRRGACAAYDPFHHKIFVFGGDQYYDYYFGETYVLTLDTLAISENKDKTILQSYLKVTSNPVKFPCQINAFVPTCRDGFSLRVVDASGKVVKDLIKKGSNSGNHIIAWDGCDNNGRRVSAGTYFILMDIDNKLNSQKLIVIK